MHRLDLKDEARARARWTQLLLEADLLVTAQRPSALARLGLGAQSLAERFPRLCHVAITGHAPPREETPGHDLTYLAEAGALTPPGAAAHALRRHGRRRARGDHRARPRDRARPPPSRAMPRTRRSPRPRSGSRCRRAYGLTTPGALLGGGHPGYNIYAAKHGWIAVAALEPHFARGARRGAGDAETSPSPALAARFATEDAEHWEAWARSRDLPIVALRQPFPPES